MNSKLLNDKLFQAVAKAYIQSLIDQNCLLQIFLEKKRSRSGKIQKPTEELFDLITMEHIIQTPGFSHKKDIKFIPITINYDTVYEGETFPMELLGESKVKESMARVLKQFSHLNKKIGKVVVKYCEPISLRSFLETY